MILLLSDVHGRYAVVNEQIAHAEARAGRAVDEVVVLGDFGFLEPDLRRFFRDLGGRFARPVSALEGNHEDFERLPRMAETYRDVVTHLLRGSVRTIDGRRCLCLGGAAYMDAHTTPRGAVVEAADIATCLAHPPRSADLILSHDSPRALGIANAPGFEHYGPPGIEEGGRLVEHFRPPLWFFGHHHRWIEGRLGGTRCIGLPQSWRGYALLDADGRVECVDREIPVPSPVRGTQAFRARVVRLLRGRGRDQGGPNGSRCGRPAS